jgi:DNA-binding response OmpR family regulator
MSVAWIYTQRAEAAEEAARMLAELGFSPRRVPINGSLRPGAEDGGAPGRRPDLALVLNDRGDAAPVCVRLREDDELGEVPIVVTVELEDLELTPEMLEAHELIVAPFTTAELSARIARARRQVHGVEDEVVRSERLELNLATYQVTVDEVPVDFTYMEYELLKFLMTHPRRAFSREALLSRVWGYDFYGGARTVDVHVRRVRAKLGTEHATKLKTVRRVGYRWEDD